MVSLKSYLMLYMKETLFFTVILIMICLLNQI